MTDNVQKIRQEVERIQLYTQSEVLKQVLDYIDEVQKEPVSEDLEIAANEWNAKALFTPFYMALDDNGNPYEVRQDYTTHAESFKAGANWQKRHAKFKTPNIPKREDISVSSRLQYIDEELKPIADFVIDYADWNLDKDEHNHPILEVPLYRVLDALAQRGKPYCGC